MKVFSCSSWCFGEYLDMSVSVSLLLPVVPSVSDRRSTVADPCCHRPRLHLHCHRGGFLLLLEEVQKTKGAERVGAIAVGGI